ncbi:MAG: sulfite exporter TauE/SafE family protein [Lachnospiraceae bacterium]|nr:sulfite exporter TauE/SafE family protein [Lachnospiraceae bacterium]
MTASIVFVVVLTLANILQAVTGFAGAPLSMPICIALQGINDAKASITLIFLLSGAVVALQNIRVINPRKLGTMLFFMGIGLVPGLWLFERLPVKSLMILYGIIVILIGMVKLISRNPAEMPKPLKLLAIILAGMMQGMFTSGGPFLALYATAELKDKQEFRATVSSVWAILNIFLCSKMYGKGMYTPNAIRLFLLSVIPVFGAIAVGNRIAKRIRPETFLRLVYVLLILSGGILLLNALG